MKASSQHPFLQPWWWRAVALCVLAAGYILLPVEVLDLVRPPDGLVGRWIVLRGEQVSLRYWHSLYDAPVEEEFRITLGGLRLTAVRSPSLACLYYYGFGSPRAGGSGWLLPGSWSADGIWLLPTELGQRTLCLRGRSYQLWRLGDQSELLLKVSWMPQLWAWCTRREPEQPGPLAGTGER